MIDIRCDEGIINIHGLSGEPNKILFELAVINLTIFDEFNDNREEGQEEIALEQFLTSVIDIMNKCKAEADNDNKRM